MTTASRLNTNAAIVLEGVHKSYPRTQNFRDILKFWKRKRNYALRGVDLVVPRGAAYGILGANGAGKTTLLKLLAGLLLPNEGRVTVDGMDATKDFGRIKQRLVYVGSDERQHYWRLTGRQNLQFYGRLYNVPASRLRDRVNELLELVGIADSADEMVIKFSTGMRQRLAIARGLIAEPRIMLLDEPTRSLDPPGARAIWAFIKDELIGRQGVTVLIATHDMEEATFLCDQVAIIHEGKIALCDTVEALTERFGTDQRVTIRLREPGEDAINAVRSLPAVKDLRVRPQSGSPFTMIDFAVNDPDTDVPVILGRLAEFGVSVSEVRRRRAGLGDVITALAEGRALP